MKRAGRKAGGLYAGGSHRMRLTGYALTGALFAFGIVMVGALTVAERLLGGLEEEGSDGERPAKAPTPRPRPS